MDKLEEARKVFNLEILALEETRDSLDSVFLEILDLITKCDGKVVFTGMGKPGHVAAKLASTFASLGTPAFHLHPAEALHGDLGMISANDIVIVISFSGESDEIVRILPNIRLIGATIIGITGNPNSSLAKSSDIVQVFPPFEEACSLGFAPTSSTSAALCYGDALAVVASKIYGFSDKNFALFHPAGNLGKKLLIKVENLMSEGKNNAIVRVKSPLIDAIIELSKKGLGAVSIVNEEGKLIGIITDGDLRRQLEKGVDVYSLNVEDIMTRSPLTISREKMAVEALKILKENNVSCLLVTEEDKPIGTIRLQDIIGEGIVV